MSGHVNSLFVCPDPVKGVNFEVKNHSSSLKLKDGPTPLYQAGAGSILCTGLIWTKTRGVAAAGRLKWFRKCWARRQGEAGQRWAMR